MTLDQVRSELYGLPPAEFVTARTERARQARDAGDKTLAAAIGKLKRPTVAAWALNLLSREAGEDVRALLEVGDALRDAQRRLSADQLRALTTERQKVVNAVTRKTAELAADRGQRLTEPVQRDIGATLQAALADQSVAEALRSGILTAAATYEGFGPAALTAVPDNRSSATRSTTAEPAEDRAEKSAAQTRTRADSTAAEKSAAKAKLRRQLDQLRAELESARAAVTSAESAHNTAVADLTALNDRIQALRTELTEAEHRHRFTAATERSTREALHQAQKHLSTLERRLDRTQPPPA
ncbi:hypothetical protein D7D52_14165 [Nocardia yunnanensis]|uniref:Uncharacterized protein n=1 Tax=Nocardia yunnanensis TaxID=2382165 RepID=A0A386ZAF8_9NOCA|nr:hypothetical protein [Nocardia yunnanensis]AYF74822.1 hypothetical protein D7D52_14165 [Nocardia yunnanensis]